MKKKSKQFWIKCTKFSKGKNTVIHLQWQYENNKNFFKGELWKSETEILKIKIVKMMYK